MNKFSVLKPVLLALAVLLSFGQVLAQMTVSGTVTDARDGSTLPGVNIVVVGTTVGTITDIDGNFTLALPASAKELMVSMVGYSSLTLPIGETQVFNIALKEATKALDEVVIVGYGTQKRSTITGSVTKLDAKLLETGVRSNPAQALAGTIPGLRVATTSGRPGSLPTIVLRGGTNFDGSGSPLIIMDGQIRGSMSDINPEEIASIEVLKDASATAIYGARASNG
ncbi:MAG TPA: carboxypeptidase-like regulatory domain-containing protein, partial [Prolixibacteraceae bacterium]|nr:carboxypeptidase-like regulatory domain-containing protein [Prolixibacteraceae bacterium]